MRIRTGFCAAFHCPHGLRFSGDGSRIFVADAGAPYIHVYANDGNGWRGVRSPITSFRVMDEAQFLRGRHNPQEGGPKGLDIDDEMNVLVVTSECQPLAFFDPAAILEGVAVPGSSDRGRQTCRYSTSSRSSGAAGKSSAGPDPSRPKPAQRLRLS